MTDSTQPPAASSPSPTSSVRRLPELTRTAMWTTAAVIAVLTAAAVVALWWPATAGLTGADLVKARLDALKIGLSIGVGSGGVVALYLAWRRQHSTEADLDNRERALAQQERAADDVRADATERRITELYTKAVEQLGSEKAPVRLGGLYALERLAQDNESQRQTIVNVLCAYLRMPYQPPEPPSDDADADQLEQHRALIQEREVRLTAQRLLGDHLQPGLGATYWGPLGLDLTSAQLIDFAFAETRIGTSTFRDATFTGIANFRRAIFTADANFQSATFVGTASFQEATFASGAGFTDATFANGVFFDTAIFSKSAAFEATTFHLGATFHATTFAEHARFQDATFACPVIFSEAKFSAMVNFMRTTFAGRVSPGEGPTFEGATVDGAPHGFRLVRITDEHATTKTVPHRFRLVPRDDYNSGA